MKGYTNGPVHRRARLCRPTYINASVANPPKRLRVQWLRSSCGHLLGIGLIGERQRVIQWAVCR